jgi:hypothetical protein
MAMIERVARRIEGGQSPLSALAAESAFHLDVECAPARALGRVLLLGDPWSLHVHGDGQLRLPEHFAAASVEVDAAPASLWVSYLLWQERQPSWKTGRPPSPEVRQHAASLDASLRASLAAAADVAGVGGVHLPDMDDLAALAAPYVSTSIRGGYGHVEIGLAARAVRDDTCHAVVSVKSFGCIPSGGVADAIVPAVLAGRRSFLPLEVADHGEAVRQSRVTMRAAEACARAEADLVDACARARIPLSGAARRARPPLAGHHETGKRPYACTLACDVVTAERP